MGAQCIVANDQAFAMHDLQQLEGGFELAVSAFEGFLGGIDHLDIGGDALAFDQPGAVLGGVLGHFGGADLATVHEGVGIREPHTRPGGAATH